MPTDKVRKGIGDTFVGLVRGAEGLVESTVKLTRGTTVRALRGATGKKTEVSRVTKSAIDDAIQTYSDKDVDFNSVVKGTVIGVIQGLGQVTRVTPAVVRDAVKAAVKGTSDRGGDAAVAARKAVEGAIEAGTQAGMRPEDAASAGATGAVEAAKEISKSVADTVTKAVSGTISGVKVLLEVSFEKPVILLVDSNRSNLELLSKHIGQEGYHTRGTASLMELDKIIQGNKRPALVIIELSGFDESIWQRCERLQRGKIPFMVISPQRSPIVQQQSIRCGAKGMLVGPIGANELVEHIRSLLGP
jgi:CheY-like chemotaxis protein